MQPGSAQMKVGPWGGHSGSPRDINRSSKPARLERITVRHSDDSGGRIYGFSFEYADQKGVPITVGPWGSKSKGSEETIELQPGEFVNYLGGTVDKDGVTSLEINTCQGSVYEYGCKTVNTFSVPLNEINGGEVISFFGISGANSLVALGVYVTGENPAVKIGAWGEPAGLTTDINTDNMPRRLLSVTIYSDQTNAGRINGFSFVYLDQNGQTIDVPTCGSTNGRASRFNLSQGEYLNCVSGTTDGYGVTSLKFLTTKGGQYGPYGCPSKQTFSVPLQQGTGAVLSFFGRSAGNSVAAIGTYVGPRSV